MRILHLFEGYGIELEYMIVDKDTLSVLPITDKVIHDVAKKYVSEVAIGEMEWSNELTLHVIELKTRGPVKTLDNLAEQFHQHIQHINTILEKFNGKLMPTPMHPWMDPYKEMRLWPHDNSPIYDAYNRIFDCRGHGWANLQSMHINLPFGNDEEFGKLHAAIRLILPILPGIAAASPIAESEKKPFQDYRLEVYRHNQSKVPSIAGKVIPEAVFTKEDYDTHVFQPLYKDISPYDPDGILQEEWLNSRGAIARWDRNTIEIRLLDIQECPKADIAIAKLVIETIKALIANKWSSYDEQKNFHEDDLAYILLDNIRYAEETNIIDPAYLKIFGLDQKECTSKDLWKHLADEVLKNDKGNYDAINFIISNGTLATRILQAVGDINKENLKRVFNQLCNCVAENKMFRA
jgi:carboxylate-amine ligase